MVALSEMEAEEERVTVEDRVPDTEGVVEYVAE